MPDPYDDDPGLRKKIVSNAEIFEYRIEALEREQRLARNQNDARNKENSESIHRRFQEIVGDYQKTTREISDALERKTKATADTLERRNKEIADEVERRNKELVTELKAMIKETEGDFDKRTSRIESFLLGGLCLVATLFIGALFAITNGSVPGAPG
jgi:lipid II:glycine glycyltransferase (peptidoglycan interpeptide bridge formation enzyme)